MCKFGSYHVELAVISQVSLPRHPCPCLHSLRNWACQLCTKRWASQGMSFAARGRAFEKTVLRALERHGFSLRLTAAGPDGGIDLKGEWVLGLSTSPTQPRRVSCAVQCKYQVGMCMVALVVVHVVVRVACLAVHTMVWLQAG